jgi:hypothetical protein
MFGGAVVRNLRVVVQVVVSTALIASAACSRQPSSPAPPAAQAPAGGMPGMAQPPGGGSGMKTVSGEVLESFDAANYTYLRVKTPTGEVWAATGRTAVTAGETVTIPLETEMRNFHSPSLNRDFPVIYFVSRVSHGSPSEAPPMAVGHGAMGSPAPGDVKVEKMAPPAGGSSIADVWARRTALAGKSVTVNGRVVKYNGGILGRNWLHVQDGSGTAADGSNDLAVTTDAVVKVGDVVTVTGIVALDKDIGAGYVYKVILEGGKIK